MTQHNGVAENEAVAGQVVSTAARSAVPRSVARSVIRNLLMDRSEAEAATTDHDMGTQVDTHAERTVTAAQLQPSPAAQRLQALLSQPRLGVSHRTTPPQGALPVEDAGSTTAATPGGSGARQRAPEQDDPLWPGLPGRMKGSEIRQLFARIATDEIFKRGFEGVSFRRLGNVLPAEQRSLVRQLLVWFDQAGILEDPPSAKARYQSVRRLRSSDPDWLAAQLHAIAAPTQNVADAAVSASLGETLP